jgi:tetrapyrrole methylase family protein / MazG family protein
MTFRQPRIVIAGLGPGAASLRTVAVQRALDSADEIILRTRIHPGLGDLASDPRVSDCDDLYQRGETFADIYVVIAQRVVQKAREGGSVVYAVPGHPRFGERTVPLVEAAASANGISVDVLEGVSFVDVSLAAVKADALQNGLQIADAEHLASVVDVEPFAAGLLAVDPTRSLLVAQLYNQEVAARLKLALTRVYPDEHPVTVIQAAQFSGQASVLTIALHALDRVDIDHLTSLWVPPLGSLDAFRSPETLLRIVAHLRTPNGCPWDRKQTHATLRDAILEEAHETVDAIDELRTDALVEELGDLLLLIAMQAQIAEEAGDFRIEDILEGVNRKLIRRHPHVFGTASATTPDDVIVTWERVKADERASKPTAESNRNPVDRLPRSMPATRKAVELLAPRINLRSPDDPASGEQLLEAVSALIAKGLDPERALEASLKRMLACGETSDEAGQEPVHAARKGQR